MTRTCEYGVMSVVLTKLSIPYTSRKNNEIQYEAQSKTVTLTKNIMLCYNKIYLCIS